MKSKRMQFLGILLLIGIILLAACQPETLTEVIEVTRVVTETVEVEGETVEVTVVVTDSDEVIVANDEAREGAPAGQARLNTTERLIIKTGQLGVTVEDTHEAVDETTDVIVGVGGYIVSQNVWESGGYHYAQMTLGVPVATFEQSMQALSQLGMVTQESATGQDVTEEFVDLESRLGNLLATQERLRSFLEEAENVEEILAVNEELSEIEEELEVIQGRMNYLADRAAFSTITLDLNPLIPTATPSPTPTATPLPTPESWRPGDTAQLAAVQLQESAQNTADFAIYSSIAAGPWLVLIGMFGFAGSRLWRRRRSGNRYPPANVGEPSQDSE